MFFVSQYSMMSTTFISLVFGLVFLFLSRQSSRKYMAMWGWCWLLYSFMFFLDFFHYTGIYNSVSYIPERQILALVASFLFLLGSFDFFHLKAPRLLYYASALSLAFTISTYLAKDLFWVLAIPNTMYCSLLLVFSGCMFISYSWTQNLPEKIIASFLIMLWSIFLNNFGFTSNYPTIGLYNYFIGILIVNLLTIFLMIIHFKKLTFLIEKHEKLLKEAETSRKMLIENISHEVRTPITLIQGYAESLLNGMVPSHATDTYIKMIQSKAIIVTRLLEDLIQASHLTSQTLDFKFYEVNIFDFFVDTINQADFHISSSNHVFKAENWVDKYAVSIIDSNRIQQVITNMINNSIRHTPPGRGISIVCSSTPTSQYNLKHDPYMTIPDGMVFFSITDEGNGISTEDLEHIFERKFIGKAGEMTGKSTGLGLFISREIIKQHSGRIWAENLPGGGAKVSFSLPYYT